MPVEHFIGFSLRGRIPYTWLRDSKLFKLTLKSVVLGPEANSEEVNIVTATTSTDTRTVRVPIAVLKAGGPQVQVRLNTIFFESVTFFLSQGKGPVHLVGTEIIGAQDDPIEEEEEEDELEEQEEEEMIEYQLDDDDRDLEDDSELVRRI